MTGLLLLCPLCAQQPSSPLGGAALAALAAAPFLIAAVVIRAVRHLDS